MRGFFSVRIKQYDWEFALWQMAYLVADPRRVFRTVFYHHQTKARPLCSSWPSSSRGATKARENGRKMLFCFFVFSLLLVSLRPLFRQLSDAMHPCFVLVHVLFFFHLLLKFLLL